MYVDILSSELSEPQKLLPYILQPEISNLAPDTIAVYIQAATKIFGYWAADIAQRWDDDFLPEIKTVVGSIISRASEFVSSPHIEVQERVSRLFLFPDNTTEYLTHYPRLIGGKCTATVHLHTSRSFCVPTTTRHRLWPVWVSFLFI